ncbi:MAG: hypothetical protein Q4G44_09610 [Alcaligenaceae bacterium]|nr:hypothetical protein [Alcaligenaceae bacterium]
MFNFKLVTAIAAALVLGACASQDGELVENDGCAVSNQRIIQSSAQVGPGPGNFLNRNRMDKAADYERERARRLDCGQY